MTAPSPSGLVAVDLVLRERERVAALPSVVRAIRRFADATMLAKLKRATKAHANAAELDELLDKHSDDLRLEALEQHNEPARDQELLPDKQASLVYDVFVYGAKRGSIHVVEWALGALPSIHVNGALRAAVNNGQLAVTQVLHPLVKKFGLGFTEDSLLNLAAARGHLEILQWMYTNRRDPRSSCTLVASENAAKSGHLEVLKWILANSPDQWSYLALEQAALHNQTHVMDWIYEKRLRRRVTSVMESLAQKGAGDALMWLHEKYPENHLFLSTLKKMASHGSQLDLVTRIVTAFPVSYASYGIVVGVICGDLELVQKLAEGRRLKRSEVKSAMCLAASYGFLDIVAWLSTTCIPTKALWRAVRCGHLHVIRWIVEQKPELLTTERLAKMQKTSAEQPTTTADRKGDMQEVTRWIEQQQQQQKTNQLSSE